MPKINGETKLSAAKVLAKIEKLNPQEVMALGSVIVSAAGLYEKSGECYEKAGMPDESISAFSEAANYYDVAAAMAASDIDKAVADEGMIVIPTHRIKVPR